MNLLSIIWDVSPKVFGIGGLEVRWYGLLFVSAFLFSYYLLRNIFKKENVSIDLLDKFTMYILAGTILGARLGHVLFYQPDYYLQHPAEILMIWEGGLASHGAAIGIFVATWLFAKKQKLNFWWLIDRLVIAIPGAGALVRLGNLMNSEIYGGATSLPWGFKFVRDYPHGYPVEMIPASHPTQIYEALGYICITLVLLFIYKSSKEKLKRWNLFGWFLILLFGLRFLVEFVKHHQVDFESEMFLNMGQWLSIPFILAGAYILYSSYKTTKLSKK